MDKRLRETRKIINSLAIKYKAESVSYTMTGSSHHKVTITLPGGKSVFFVFSCSSSDRRSTENLKKDVIHSLESLTAENRANV